MAMTPARARAIFATLEVAYPGADTELHFRTAFELLVATILSAQSTDERVNLVTPALFATYPDARALAVADPAAIEPIILQTGFFRQKARSIVRASQLLVERHDGEVPAAMHALVDLPGVGRKTANVVLGHALGIPGLPVDRHVLRVANRIGLAQGEDPVEVEQQLCALIDPSKWTLASDTLILHGRRVCRPKPECGRCLVRDRCAYVKAIASGARAAPSAPGRATNSRVARAASVPGRARARGTAKAAPRRPKR